MKTNRFEFQIARRVKDPMRAPSFSHAWRGAWDRPMTLDERTQHPFTVARMTDHNVRGVDFTDPVKRKKAA